MASAKHIRTRGAGGPLVVLLAMALLLSACAPSLTEDDNFDLSGGLPKATLTAQAEGAAGEREASLTREIAADATAVREVAQVTATPAATGQAQTADAGATATPAPAIAVDDDGNKGADGASDYEPVQFTGTVEDMPGGNGWNGEWLVAGYTVFVAPSTVIDQRQGALGEGAEIEVEGWRRPDGSVNAGWVHVLVAAPDAPPVTPAPTSTPVPVPQTGDVADLGPAPEGAGKEVAFAGNVQRTPEDGLLGVWVIGGRVVHVNPGTRLDLHGIPTGEAIRVRVSGWLQPDGSLNAASLATTDDDRDDDQKNDQNDDRDDGKGEDRDDWQGQRGANDRGKIEFRGTVDQLPGGGLEGTWLIDELPVIVDSGTKIGLKKRRLAEGTYVSVKGFLQDDGSVRAAKIEAKDEKDDKPGRGPKTVPPGQQNNPGRGNNKDKDKGNG